VEGTRVRDLLPRAPAKLSKQIEIGDIILKVDNREATPKEVLTMLRGVDQGIVPSSCSRAPTTHCSAMDSRICDFTYCHSTLTQRVCVCVCVWLLPLNWNNVRQLAHNATSRCKRLTDNKLSLFSIGCRRWKSTTSRSPTLSHSHTSSVRAARAGLLHSCHNLPQKDLIQRPIANTDSPPSSTFFICFICAGDL
jgi:hypothetical protein